MLIIFYIHTCFSCVRNPYHPHVCKDIVCQVSLLTFVSSLCTGWLCKCNCFPHSAVSPGPHPILRYSTSIQQYLICLPFGASELMTVMFLVLPGKLMSALLNGIHDRSTIVQKAFAFALGHLVRVGTTFSKRSY